MSTEERRQAMRTKTALVTGGTRGIGKEAARGLLELGANVVIVGRDEVRGEAAAAELRETSGNGDVVFLPADLSVQAEVRRLADQVTDRLSRLDVLVNNAAVVRGERRMTIDGIEETLAVGHLAPFVLTELLVPLLRRSAPARVVNVSSGVVHRAEMPLDDLDGEESYDALTAYGRAKLFNLAWTFELSEHLQGDGISVFAVDPGVADTGTHRNYPRPAPIRAAMSLVRAALRRQFSAERAARGVVYAASAAELEGRTGVLLDRNGQPTDAPQAATGREAGHAVRQVSCRLAGHHEEVRQLA